MRKTIKKTASLALILILLLSVLPGSVLAASLTVSSITASKTAVNAGEAVTWTAAASGGTGSYRYCFYIFKDGAILERGSYGTASTRTYTPEAGGVYTVRVYVKDSSNTVANKTGGAVTVTGVPIAVDLTVSKTAANAGEAVTWTAAASGGTESFKYCFYIFKNGAILERGSYGAASTRTYTPEEGGVYTVRVYVKDSSGKVETKTGGQCTVTAPLALVSFEPMFSELPDGNENSWTVNVTGGAGPLKYCFYIFRNGKIWERGSYSSNNTYTCTLPIIGTYTARVYVKDAAGTVTTFECDTPVDCFTAHYEPITVTSVRPNVSYTEVLRGQYITWTAVASGGYGDLEYCFYLFINGEIVSRNPWSTDNTLTLEILDAGQTYHIRVYVRDCLPETVPVACEGDRDLVSIGA